MPSTCPALPQSRTPVVLERGDRGVERGHVDLVGRADPAAPQVVADVGQQQPQRGGHARMARDDDARDPEVGGDRAGVHRTGAAERGEREAARIVAAGDRHHAQRVGHVRVGDPHDRRGGGLDGQPQRLGHRAIDRLARRLRVEPDAAAERPRRVERAEHEVGVGQRRVPAAGAVRGRARVGARAVRADRERAEAVDRGDRAAARADGEHVDLRQVDRVPAVVAAGSGAAAGRRPRARRRWSSRPCRT